MSLLQSKLSQYVGQEIVVVMMDNRAFRGTLVEHDADVVVLRNVVEALPNNAAGWEEPTVSTGIVQKVVTWHGTFSHEDTSASVVKLKDVMIRLSGVLRIWEFSMKNVTTPEHVEVADAAAPRPGTRVSKKF
ncbi:MAG TPA: LSM domain-containing protein [Candidatus Thermoplasmatota archaeon]|nr:LSM domain-containing protein [Candidatus Thermoplasmatota archaeon]